MTSLLEAANEQHRSQSATRFFRLGGKFFHHGGSLTPTNHNGPLPKKRAVGVAQWLAAAAGGVDRVGLAVDGIVEGAVDEPRAEVVGDFLCALSFDVAVHVEGVDEAHVTLSASGLVVGECVGVVAELV